MLVKMSMYMLKKIKKLKNKDLLEEKGYFLNLLI
jgi:hypothetical protein